ncbi:MAG: AraC family transcriptional regulator [Christensenellales bacterium]
MKYISSMENSESFRQLGPQIAYSYDVNLLNVGYEKCDPLHYVGPLKKLVYLLHVVLDGKGQFRVNGTTYNLKRGDVFLINPDDLIYYQADRNDPWEYRWVRFNGRSVPLLFEGTGILEKKVFHSKDEAQFERLVDYLTSIFNYFDEGMDMYFPATGQFYLFLWWFRENFGEVEGADAGKTNLVKVINYINSNFTQQIDMEKISRSIGYNRSHIYKLFIKHLNCSPKEYIESLRMNLACEMLYETSRTVREIAGYVGYNSYASFVKIFKKKYEISPTEYREAYCIPSKEKENG